jgi:hypothetical protein
VKLRPIPGRAHDFGNMARRARLRRGCMQTHG